jgi:DNA helicase-2/ATP-dependent DNA helicase PcrA
MSSSSDTMLDALNPSQRDAVTHRGGPLVVLAGAGSGKTRVITHRIAHLIEADGVEPASIAALTFTNRAADEMRERVRRLLASRGDERADDVILSTFHSLGARILRRYGHRIGLDRDFSILDQRDQADLLRDTLERTGRNVDRSQRRAWQSYIERSKNRAVTPEEARAQAATDDELARAAVYADYQQLARERNCADFGDLLLGCLELFRDDASLAREYGERWQHLMVDEFQDTNPAQYEWLEHLTTVHRNLVVVGDDDQSIYRWRGADIGNILNFESDYPSADVVRLERNYRSSQLILDAARDVVEHNPDRRSKELWTSREGGEPITCFVAETARGEAAFVADELRRLLDEEGLEPDSMAVFYRTNDQSQRLEEQCRAEEIPYRMRGTRSFYEYREIRDLLAYLKLALNPDDDVSALRILGVPPRGIGDATVDKLKRASDVPGLDSIWDAVRWAADSSEPLEDVWPPLAPEPTSDAHERALGALDGLKGRPARGVEAFVELFSSLRADLEGRASSSTEVVQMLIERLDYSHYLERRHGDDAGGRKDRVREFMRAVRSFEGEYGEEGAPPIETLRDFLERSALVREESTDTDPRDAVTLTTVHGAKGLEFDTVFIVGLEEGLFPHVDDDADPVRLREERRLAYVALTRAERKIHATWALERRRRGEWSRQTPSRFLFEIDDERLEMHERSRVDDLEAWSEESSGWTDGWGRSSDGDDGPDSGGDTLSDERAEATGASTSRDDADGETADLVGRRVEHAKFGEGTVRDVAEAGGRTKLEIDFSEHGRQTIVRSFVDLVDE